MSEVYRIASGPVAGSGGLAAVTLTSPEGVAVSFVPEAGMVGCALTVGDTQVLGMRQGMQPYLDNAKTFGIPLLAPWANRLAHDIYSAAGKEATVAGVHGVHRDPNGLAIHGLLSGARGWRVTAQGADREAAELRAELDFDHNRDEYDAFPFPHLLGFEAELRGSTLTIVTSVTPTTDQAVPVAFGWHPYFVIPDLPRAQWELAIPFTDRVVLSDALVPTGEVDGSWRWTDGPLGDRIVDDLFAGVRDGATVTLSGGGLSITVEYTAGYPYAVVYAPAEDDVVAIEPMTAPTDPFSGNFPLLTVAPGDTYRAEYRISVETE
jgi:galactose mutarotase-like enzyme